MRLVTATPGLGLGVTGADCGMILFADSQARVIGAAHAGWKGRPRRRARSHNRGDGNAWRAPRCDGGRSRSHDLAEKL